jgi:hypothetical protein
LFLSLFVAKCFACFSYFAWYFLQILPRKMELRVGNKYRLGRKIGSGSFGDIYLGKASRILCETQQISSLVSVFFQQGPTLQPERRLQSSWNASRHGTLNCTLSPNSIKWCKEEVKIIYLSKLFWMLGYFTYLLYQSD